MRHWRADVLSAFEHAAKLYDRGEAGIDDWQDLYKLAARFAAENRGIKDKATQQKMLEYSIEGVEYDHQVEPRNKDKVLFHFTIAYVDAHVAAGLVGELEADKIMEYLNENIEFFPVL